MVFGNKPPQGKELVKSGLLENNEVGLDKETELQVGERVLTDQENIIEMYKHFASTAPKKEGESGITWVRRRVEGSSNQYVTIGKVVCNLNNKGEVVLLGLDSKYEARHTPGEASNRLFDTETGVEVTNQAIDPLFIAKINSNGDISGEIPDAILNYYKFCVVDYKGAGQIQLIDKNATESTSYFRPTADTQKLLY